MNILIYRPDNIGDVLLFSGAFKPIRERYPEARITLAVQAKALDLVALCPYVDRCVTTEELDQALAQNRAGGIMGQLRRRLIAFTAEAVETTYDLVICPVRSPQPKHLRQLAALDAKERIGIRGCPANAPPDGLPDELMPEYLFSKSLDVSGFDPWRLEFQTTRDFLHFIGCPEMDSAAIAPEFWLEPADRSLLDDQATSQGPIIGIFPFAAEACKQWEAQNYHAMAAAVGGAPTYVLFGAQQEVVPAETLETYLRQGAPECRVVNFVGRTRLRELCRTVEACDAVVSVDTAGLHLAIALDIPSVAIVGGGHYGRFIPWGDETRHRFLTQKLSCFHCGWQCTLPTVECIQGVTAAAVAAELKQLLSAHAEDTVPPRAE